MQTRASRNVFINKDDLDFILNQIDHYLTCNAKWTSPEGANIVSLFDKLSNACHQNRRFTIEVENCYEIVPPGQRLERKLGYAKREKGPRRGKGGNHRGAAESEGRLEND